MPYLYLWVSCGQEIKNIILDIYCILFLILLQKGKARIRLEQEINSVCLLWIMATVARYPLLWPDKPSVAISILTKLLNTLAEYPSTYKCCSYIRSAKTPVRPCISLTMTPVTSFALQPSYSNPCHQFRYYRSCHHKIQFAMRWLLLL
jgi:hypothetical protein